MGECELSGMRKIGKIFRESISRLSSIIINHTASSSLASSWGKLTAQIKVLRESYMGERADIITHEKFVGLTFEEMKRADKAAKSVKLR